MQYDLTLPLLVVGVGFLAAVTIGSIAWFNSKRPPGWETSERPNYVPKVGPEGNDRPSDSNNSTDTSIDT